MAEIKDLGNGLYELPGGVRVHSAGGMPDRQQAFLLARHAVTREYLDKWGKTVEDLSIDEVMEIRKDPRWKNPLGEDGPVEELHLLVMP